MEQSSSDPAKNQTDLPGNEPGYQSDERLDTFGERLGNAPQSDRIPLDEFGEPMYHDHDELGEWLARDFDWTE
jgi:hypothetical protein